MQEPEEIAWREDRLIPILPDTSNIHNREQLDDLLRRYVPTMKAVKKLSADTAFVALDVKPRFGIGGFFDVDLALLTKLEEHTCDKHEEPLYLVDFVTERQVRTISLRINMIGREEVVIPRATTTIVHAMKQLCAAVPGQNIALIGFSLPKDIERIGLNFAHINSMFPYWIDLSRMVGAISPDLACHQIDMGTILDTFGYVSIGTVWFAGTRIVVNEAVKALAVLEGLQCREGVDKLILGERKFPGIEVKSQVEAFRFIPYKALIHNQGSSLPPSIDCAQKLALATEDYRPIGVAADICDIRVEGFKPSCPGILVTGMTRGSVRLSLYLARYLRYGAVHVRIINISSAASDLYDTSTHFLLELLQNADDNQYPLSLIPTLTFTCRENTGSLRVDCNETGFEAKHVKAISTVRRSTKSNKNHSGGYTGEKGIGFKSVFRVAERVWISSRQYRFMFDKKEQFGMIAPKWAEFPESVLPAQTSFYLKLSEVNASEDLAKELRDFDASLLVFLRRIRQVVLRVHDKDNKVWERRLHKTLVLEDGEPVTIVDVDQSQLRYHTFAYQVENLPFEEKRSGSRTSELTLAFPTSGLPAQPSRSPQYVHALLPFLLNGDFLLTADRSHIDVSSPWNQSLRDGLAAAFIQAVQKFSQGSMKYFWPFFVPDSEVSSFFQPSREMILQDLAERAVLEGWDGTMLRPSNLVYVSLDKYSDEDRRPFTLHQHTISRYLSIKYPEWLIDSLLDLGVCSMSDVTFLNDLESMVSNYPGKFRRRPPAWHSQLAKALLPLAQVASHKETLSRLAIIPLSGGTWTSADQQPAFFSDDLDPKSFGVFSEVLIVDPAAAADDNRRSLFQKLGISEIDRPDMCSKIAKLHASTSFDPLKIPRTKLISHAIYLFQASWHPDFDVDLWFATSDGGVCKGSELYIRGDFEDGSPSARVFDKLRKEFPTAHKGYISRINSASLYKKYPDMVHFEKDAPEKLRLDSTSNNELHFSDTAEDLNQKSATVTDSVFETGTVGVDQPATSTKSSVERHFSLLDESYLENLIVKEKKSFRSYLINTLHLSEIPRLVRESIDFGNRCYFLSEEFKFLFKECSVSDVLYLLSEHWNIYSEWIEPSSFRQKHPNTADFNMPLLHNIKHTIVHTLHGPAPIYNTFLPSLDPRVEELQIPIPILDIDGSEDQSFRRKLGCLGINVDVNIYFYLACLTSLGLQQGSPDNDVISYVYEQIQSRFEDDPDSVM
ncbi:hypothetical protein GL218_06286 [Daldinia childiae]|uniref:uncharacterized protein n=1 Tax=Daldinia childiae TaxID=326645 RepID=UPI00144738A3|nr:uncharacterized protein GL218_06286 [Daldinia childiae]KAF3057207.1 hypothetical protein GL218_06286 [Daldinia childiae]